MKPHKIWKKSLVIGIVFLCFGVGFLSSISGVRTHQQPDTNNIITISPSVVPPQNSKRLPDKIPSSPGYVPTFAGDGVNIVSPENLLPGDFVILGTDDTFFDYLIPGKYSHTEMYCGKVQPGESIWDRDNHCWMSVGTPYVIHSTKGGDSGNGLGYSTWTVGVNHHADNALVFRVLKPGGIPLTEADRKAVVNYAKSKLSGGLDGYPIGPPYDWNWFGQQLGVDSIWPAPAGYYCSELIWASYLATLGVDLDSDTSPFSVGVSPDDLWHSQYTSVIAAEVGNIQFNASRNMIKLTVFVDEVYYDDDYDPWPAGAGEEYLISRSGLDLYDDDFNHLATEQGYPGCGKIGDTPDGYWSRDGAGPLDWNAYFYTLVPLGQNVILQIEAWELDDTSANDQYPAYVMQLSSDVIWFYQDWGWFCFGERIDLGDCRYTVRFRMDTIAHEPDPVCGDVDGDGSITIADAVQLFNYIFGQAPEPDPLCCADANGDGGIDISDTCYLIQYIFAGGTPPHGCC